jgi:cysteine synthase A
LQTRDHTRIRGLGSLIGNTPLLAIKFQFQGHHRTIYAKAENLNMTGSIKDRMAFHIIEQAYARQILKPGSPIIEATSGNTGISFSAIGRALGHPVTPAATPAFLFPPSAVPWAIRSPSLCRIG